ncbi:MAG: GAF domain-containing protein [Leptolyngbya sp. SIO1E4]|nr:GAF domain-containing protein [Leptolyngbya sp. SIO1E4]
MAQFLDSSAFATQTVSADTYTVLRQALLEQAHQPDDLLITEADFHAQWRGNQPWAELVLVITQATQGLLVKQVLASPSPIEPDLCSVGMMTDPQALITAMAGWLEEEIDAAVQQRLLQGQQQLRDRPATACPNLILSLLPILTTSSSASQSEPPTPSPLPISCQPVQDALDQHLEQSLLLGQVLTKIRHSLDLPSILSTTVTEVRQSLEVDRLLIYEFQRPASDMVSEIVSDLPGLDLPASPTPDPSQDTPQPGRVTYESLSSRHIDSVMNFTEESCFDAYTKHHPNHGTESPVVVNDVQEQYRELPCFLNFLQKAQVRAKVIAPIWVHDRLWGLLIAHHCYTPRQWHPREGVFLQHIAEHLSIAIQQAELSEQLEGKAHCLENCVVDRTHDLRDALAAAQTASLAKSEFLTTMSHELRTPLTCIIGMSATLLRWSFGELSPRQRNYLTTIHESGERLLAMINDILDIAKIESGRTVLEVQSFSLTSLAQKALEPCRQQARDRHIELTFEATLLTDQDTFTGDPRRIQQILDNLLSNALKFTADEGKINLRLRRENQTAIFQVEDTGIGIPESQMSLMFEKFQQLENSRQRQYQGTGLGLALTKQLTELHGGTISVNSRVGVGSVFTVRLPLQRLETQSPDLDAQAEAPLAAAPVIGRVVLVEDQEETAGVICDLLTAADYQVIWVIEGSRVVEQVALLQPTIVVINMQLNGIDGQRIIEALRDSLVTAPVKILALSSPHTGSTAVQGADVTMTLPLDPEILLEKVNALVAMAAV